MALARAMKYLCTERAALSHPLCRSTAHTRPAQLVAVAPLGGLLLFSATLGACVPDIDALGRPSLSSGAGGCDTAACEPSAGSGGQDGGTAGSVSGGSSGSGAGGAAGAGGSYEPPPEPEIRFDFETAGLSGLQGWQAVGNQRPPGVQDAVEQTTEDAHSGTGSLRMVFDGDYAGSDAGAPPADPYYGVYRQGAIPNDRELTLWMKSTADDVSVELYAQTGTSFAWNVMGNASLLSGQWQEIHVVSPPAEVGTVGQYGLKIYSPLDIDGYVYLDEVSW